jgi:hypothetical protein
MAEPLKVLIYDIETSPLEVRAWRLNQQFINPEMVKEDYFLLTWSAKWWGSGEPAFSSRLTKKEVQSRDDKRIVAKLGKKFLEADVIVAHYGDKFDWPKVNGRLMVHGLEAPGYITKIDTKKLYGRHTAFASNSLDYLGRVLGEGRKNKTDWSLWARCLDGPDHVAALREMEVYNLQDVELLTRVFTRGIPYFDRVARLYEATHAREDICLYCGSGRVQHRGYYRTQGYTYHKLQCRGRLPNGRMCGKYRRSKLSIHHKTAAGHPL